MKRVEVFLSLLTNTSRFQYQALLHVAKIYSVLESNLHAKLSPTVKNLHAKPSPTEKNKIYLCMHSNMNKMQPSNQATMTIRGSAPYAPRKRILEKKKKIGLRFKYFLPRSMKRRGRNSTSKVAPNQFTGLTNECSKGSSLYCVV